MPRYDYHCETCGTEWEEDRKIADRDVPCNEPCPHHKTETGFDSALSIKRGVAAPRLVSGVNLHAKVPHGFRDVLSRIKDAHPHHKIQGDLS